MRSERPRWMHYNATRSEPVYPFSRSGRLAELHAQSNEGPQFRDDAEREESMLLRKTLACEEAKLAT